MNIVSKNRIAAVLLGGTAFIGGAAMAQEQSVDSAGTAQGGANVVVPQAGASGQVDTSDGANTSAIEGDAGADAAASKRIENGSAAEGSAPRVSGGTGAETAGSTGTAVEKDSAKSSQLNANGQSSTTKDAETAADAPAAEQSDEASTSKPSNETTASINITTEQRTEIRNVIVESKAEPVDLDIQVNVGVVVPKTVELRPLPPRIIEIVPAYRSYEYFVLADGRIIIVEPGTLKVVYVIAA
ncbi:DUF1236 domain-containing protein (plasmid) [Shinella yambaruensis]|uniref:DUF1236 domain-containing protein n=1 Tax=Shinella yambaruensis TaxID=415996 RepID=UPI003D78F393